jgi:hypothetical protein
MPLPSPDTTPPVTKMYFTAIKYPSIHDVSKAHIAAATPHDIPF